MEDVKPKILVGNVVKETIDDISAAFEMVLNSEVSDHLKEVALNNLKDIFKIYNITVSHSVFHGDKNYKLTEEEEDQCNRQVL